MGLGNVIRVSLVFPGTRRDAFVRGYRGEMGFYRPYFSELIDSHYRFPKAEMLYVIAPLFFEEKASTGGTSDHPAFVPMLDISREISLSLDELKSVHSVKCELLFDGELPPKVD